MLELGKMIPMDKLVEVASQGIGRITKSYFDKKDIDTEAYRINTLAAAQALANQITNNSQKEQLTETQKSNLSLEERTQSRVSFQEQKKQINLEKVIAVAAEELKNEQTVTDEALDEDWITRFFKNAADISDEEMQSLWGKILAGEIKQPKTYSLRTLELVKNLTKEETQLFEKVAHFAIEYGYNRYYLFQSRIPSLADYDIHFGREISPLIDIGLIKTSDITLTFDEKSASEKKTFLSRKIVFFADIKANTPVIRQGVYAFTKAGNELLTMLKPETPFEYLKGVAKSMESENVTVKYANITWRQGSKFKHDNLLLDFS